MATARGDAPAAGVPNTHFKPEMEWNGASYAAAAAALPHMPLHPAVHHPGAETNSLYWPWYCNSTSFWQHLLKALLTGVLPSIISTVWDTYALPLLFYFLAQARC